MDHAGIRKARRLVRAPKPEIGEATSQRRVRKHRVDRPSRSFCYTESSFAHSVYAAIELERVQRDDQSTSTHAWKTWQQDAQISIGVASLARWMRVGIQHA